MLRDCTGLAMLWSTIYFIVIPSSLQHPIYSFVFSQHDPTNEFYFSIFIIGYNNLQNFQCEKSLELDYVHVCKLYKGLYSVLLLSMGELQLCIVYRILLLFWFRLQDLSGSEKKMERIFTEETGTVVQGWLCRWILGQVYNALLMVLSCISRQWLWNKEQDPHKCTTHGFAVTTRLISTATDETYSWDVLWKIAIAYFLQWLQPTFRSYPKPLGW